MAMNPPPFAVEDGTDDDFFDKLVNDDEDVGFKVTTSWASGGLVLTDGNESDEAKAFANLSINELDDSDELNFDNTSNHMGVDDLCATMETVEHINKVGIVEERGNPLVSSSSFEFDSLIQNLGNENRGTEVLPDATVVSNTTDEGISDVTMLSKSSGGTEAPGVKEVGWSAFRADSAQNDGNGFGSYSDFFSKFEGDNTGDDFAHMVGDTSKNGTLGDTGNALHGSSYVDNSNKYNGGCNDVIVADQSSFMQDLNSRQYWENQYPGWKYDPNTGQWYQVDGYDAGERVQSNVDSSISSTRGVADKQEALSYMQQTAQSVSGAVATTESVTNWNQVSQVSDAAETATNWNQVSQLNGDSSNGIPSDWNLAPRENNCYPPHMVFDPQYPGWYYNTIAQNWFALSSYTAPAQSTTHGEMQMNQDEYASTETLARNNSPKAYSTNGQDNRYISRGFSTQGTDKNWSGSVRNYNQQSSRTWQPETVASSEATSMYNGNQAMGNQYGQNVSLNIHGNHKISVHYGVKSPHYENLSQDDDNFSVVGGGNLSQHLNDATINQNDQKHVSNDFYSNQNSVNFPQQQIHNAHISYTPVSGRSSAGRPAHAMVGFGFGGKLIVIRHNSIENLNFGCQNPVGGSISILNLAEVVNSNADTLNHGMSVSNYFQALCRQSILGPLTGGSVSTKEVNKWIDERITNLKSADMDHRRAEVLSLLLSLLKISCQYYGKLRSPYGTDAVLKESDSPESAVAKLFASARSGSQVSQYGAVAQCLQQLPSEGQMRVNAVKVQNLLVSGRKKEALQCAQEGQLWGPALVLAAQLGDQFYVETVKQMALRHLVAGSPLRTLCLLIAGQPADVFSTESTGVSSMNGAVNMSQQPAQLCNNDMLDDWEENLAVITANRTKDVELVLIHLGDCLWKERSDIIAAHICYLVAEANFEPYSDSARLCLIGADHWKFPRTYSTPEAIQRTEIYEYSKTLGNSQFVLLTFQPYKFVYALMLAEVGRISEALKYCQAVLKSLKTGRSPEVEILRHLVSSLEERIKAHQQGGFSSNLAPKEFIGKLLNLFDSTAHRVVGGLPPSIPTGGTVHGIENLDQSIGPRVPTSQSTMAMSSLAPSQSMEPIGEWAADSNKMAMHTRSISEPDFGRSPKGQADTWKEASPGGVQDKGSAAGGTSRFGRFGFGSQLLQKTVGLVLKPRQGHQAKLGETNKFYYDEKLKRWVEEGAEPPAEEAAFPPPPTTTVFQHGTPEYNLKSAFQSEAFHNNGSQEFKSPSTADNIPGMPPLPPTTNQYSARGRMGVRSRYVDTFNQGGGNATSSFQSPLVPSIKPASGANQKFFVPTPVSNVEQSVGTPVNIEQNTSSTFEYPSFSLNDSSFQSPASPSIMNTQRYASMNNIMNKETNHNGSFSVHSRRTASWSGSYNDSFSPPPQRAEGKLLGEVLGMQPSIMLSNPSLVHSSMNGGSIGDDLHEVQL
ncbi:protein transport protein sec16b homolog [Phtheirospermum japonicum]|uniref:Protein transport protein sec16 n=1 Tax=Phtheirospermum japonicum TaxID=374723 RepID=A0A830CAP8_9LAMI|nr:protein transport protein sec16b homolog [Phtheirospermum japonicum]